MPVMKGILLFGSAALVLIVLACGGGSDSRASPGSFAPTGETPVSFAPTDEIWTADPCSSSPSVPPDVASTPAYRLVLRADSLGWNLLPGHFHLMYEHGVDRPDSIADGYVSATGVCPPSATRMFSAFESTVYVFSNANGASQYYSQFDSQLVNWRANYSGWTDLNIQKIGPNDPRLVSNICPSDCRGRFWSNMDEVQWLEISGITDGTPSSEDLIVMRSSNAVAQLRSIRRSESQDISKFAQMVVDPQANLLTTEGS